MRDFADEAQNMENGKRAMKGLHFDNRKANTLLLTAMIFLLTFQNPLETVWSAFSYIDECAALIGAVCGTYEIVVVQRCRATKEQLWVGVPLLIFVVAGLAGNLLYRYQPMKAVIVDLYTNLKFFFAIGTGYYLFRNMDWGEMKRIVVFCARSITLALFVVFLADRLFGFWPSEVRHGIRSAVLFYSHPTYFAGAVAFLLTLLTVFYEKKNIPCIAMALVMIAFTMRSKAFASVAAYVALFVLFAVLQWKLKWQYVLVGGVACAAIAWPQIRFYFVDLAGHSARSVMLLTSFLIMKDYFPIGTGFGTYASAEAAKNYSPVYLKYGFNNYWELRDTRDMENTLRLIRENAWLSEQYQQNPDVVNWTPFLSDTFWPIIFGQTGVIGTLLYVLMLGVIVKRCMAVEKYDRYAYVSALFVFAYLLISSMAEPAFHNSVAIPLALVLGLIFGQIEAMVSKKEE